MTPKPYPMIGVNGKAAMSLDGRPIGVVPLRAA